MRLWPILLFLVVNSFAQKQLVLLKNGKPVGRFTEGEYIHFIMKDGSNREGKIVELMEFSVITSNDTVQFNKIHKIGIPKGQRRGIAPLFGGLLLGAGVTYLTIDLVNSALGYNTSGVDQDVVKASAVMISVGSILFFIRPKYRRVNEGTFLRTVDYKSKFYKSPYG
ncbi:MAG: hypothetical protein JNL40_08295 [Cyclobacteriaceae bacterium]|nr:hypothetical protein [Cyclobacteriaceae bacterium]